MKKVKTVIVGSLLLSAGAYGCSQPSHDQTIEYGEKFDLAELLEVDEDTEFSLLPDRYVVGVYTIDYLKDQQAKVKVEDTQPPVIELYQEDCAKIHKGTSYDAKANVKCVEDPVDGKIKGIEILSKEDFTEKVEEAKDYNESLDERTFEKKEDITTAKKEQKDHSFIIISGEVDTDKEGIYMIEVAASDVNGNVSRTSFRIEVVDEKENIDQDEQAVGSEERPKEDSSKESQESKPSSNTSSNSKPSGSSSSAANITDPVAKAALARVGQQLSCDDLVSYALIDTGRISGGDDWMRTVGVYYFPQLCTKVSASQAKQGDIIYYADGGTGSPHVAIYLGGEEAVHGGYNGLNVVRTTIYLGGGPTYYLRFPSHMSWDEINEAIFGEASGFFDDDPATDDVVDSSNSGNPSNEGNMTVSYTSTFSVNDLVVTVESSTPIDKTKVRKLLEQVYYEEITYDDMVSQLKGMGYTVK